MEAQDDTRSLSMAASGTWEKGVSLMLGVIWNCRRIIELGNKAPCFNRLLHSTGEVERIKG